MLDGNETSDQKPDRKSFEELGQTTFQDVETLADCNSLTHRIHVWYI